MLVTVGGGHGGHDSWSLLRDNLVAQDLRRIQKTGPRVEDLIHRHVVEPANEEEGIEQEEVSRTPSDASLDLVEASEHTQAQRQYCTCGCHHQTSQQCKWLCGTRAGYFRAFRGAGAGVLCGRAALGQDAADALHGVLCWAAGTKLDRRRALQPRSPEVEHPVLRGQRPLHAVFI